MACGDPQGRGQGCPARSGTDADPAAGESRRPPAWTPCPTRWRSAVTHEANPLSQMLSREAFRLLAPGSAPGARRSGRHDRPWQRAAGRGLGGLGDREQHVGSGPRGGEPADRSLGRDSWPRGGSDVAGRGAIQRPGSAVVPSVRRAGTARRTGGRPAGCWGSRCGLGGVSAVLPRRPGCRARWRPSACARRTVEQLAQEAAQQWTAGFNPRPVTAGDFVSLYQAV